MKSRRNEENLWRLVEVGSPVAKALALTILDWRLGGRIRKRLRELSGKPHM